ncbi:uncharacterized protein LOC144106878 isoform X2 [Amblyomma americanum]
MAHEQDGACRAQDRHGECTGHLKQQRGYLRAGEHVTWPRTKWNCMRYSIDTEVRTQARMATMRSMAFLIHLLAVFNGVELGLAEMAGVAGVALSMNLKVQAFWLGTAPQDCMVAFSCSKGGHLENLYIHFSNTTELYNYKDNLFYEKSGKKSGNAVKFTATKSIPESKKVNPLFPLGFCTEGNGNEGLMEGSLSTGRDWHAYRNITVLGEIYQCLVSVVYPSTGEQRLRHTEDAPFEGYCHLMPLDVAARCGVEKTIRNYMYNCTDKVDWTIFEPSPDEVMDNTTKPPHTKKPVDGMSGRDIIITGVSIFIAFVFLGIVLAWRCGWRLTRKAPSHLAQYEKAREIVALNPNTAYD